MAATNWREFRQWLLPVSASLTLVTGAVSIWEGVQQYKLGVQAENRLREAAQVEADVRLSQLFIDLMQVAHARAGSHVSEECVKQLFDKKVITDEDLRALSSAPPDAHFTGYFRPIDTKTGFCVIDLPVGAVSQNAAITSIAVLAKRYQILREPARDALNSLKILQA